MKLSAKWVVTILLTIFSIYLVFALNEEGPLRILFNLLTFAGIYGLAAIGLNVHFGLTGLLNFGHASFMGVGAYVTLLLIPHAAGREGEITESGLPFLLALLIGIISASLFGLLLGLPAIRLRGDYLAIVTIAAAEILERDYKIDSNVWSVTSFSELRRDAIEIERFNLLNPDEKPKKSYLEQCLSSEDGPILASSDYMRLNSDQIRPYLEKSFYSLGTDGYGRSDTRKNLRKFFEVDKEHIVAYSLSVLAKEQLVPSKYAKEAIKKYNIDPEKPIPTKL